MKKFLSSILALVFLTTSSFAQSVPTGPQPLPSNNVYVIDDFSAFLRGHSSPYNLTKGEAQDAYNIRSNDEYGSLTKRPALNLYGSLSHSSAVTGLTRYYTSDGIKRTVASSATFLDYVSDAGAVTNLMSGASAGARWNFVTYKNNLIATNGKDYPQKWDGVTQTTADTAGSRSATYLTTQLGAPFTQQAAGAGLTASKWYQYLIAYYDGTSYWYSQARSNPLLTGASANKQVSLTGIPLGPALTTKRYIYRTLGDASDTAVKADTTYYLVATINDNVTTTLTDAMSDATAVGAAAPTWGTVTSGGLNVTPPHGAFPFINQGYFWLANDASGVQYGQSTAYFSSVGNPDYFLATSYFLVRPDDGDAITFINSFLGTLTIGKTNTISKIYTSSTSPTSWQVSQPFSFIGCIAPYSAVSTPLGIIYLGRYGIYQFDGQSSSIISDVVTDVINDIATFSLPNVTSMLYKNEYRMAYTSSSSGGAVNNRVLILDMVRKDWVKDTEGVNTWAVFNSSSDFGGLYSGSSGTDGSILAHSTQPTQLVQRYLTDLTAGTFSNATSTGTQNSPILQLGSSAWSATATAWNAESTSTWNADASPGTWTSPIFQVNANALYQLYWNVNTPVGTTVTMAIRSADTLGGIAGASWSPEYTNPSGSDISAQSAKVYTQLRATLSTSNLGVTPTLYVQDNYMIQMVYSQTGTAYETSIPSSWVSGWIDLTTSNLTFYLSNMPKVIKEVDIYYEGTSGTLSVGLQNLKGDSNTTFAVDLSQGVPLPQAYWGNGLSKVYRWLPGFQGSANPPPVGDKFMLSFSENGVTPWRIQRISIVYDVQPYSPYHGS